MTLCPIAMSVGCARCPVFKVCPLKSVIGDQPKAAAAPDSVPARSAKGSKSTPSAKRKK